MKLVEFIKKCNQLQLDESFEYDELLTIKKIQSDHNLCVECILYTFNSCHIIHCDDVKFVLIFKA